MDKKKNNVIKWDYIIMTCILFLIVYNPPIKKGVSFTIIFVAWAMIEFVLHYQYIKKYILCLEIFHVLVKIVKFLVYFIFMGLIFSFFNNKSVAIINNVVKCVGYNMAIFFIALYIVYRSHKKKYELQELITVYVFIGVIQSVFSIISFCVPSVRLMFRNLMVANVNHDNIAELVYWTDGMRCFGFASTLFDIFGCAMAIIAILALNIAVSEKRIYFLFFILISFSAIINSRTSVVLIVIGSVVTIVSNMKQISTIKHFRKMFSIGICCLVGGVVLYNFVANSSLTTSANWFSSGMESIKSLLFEGESVDYFDTLFNHFLFLPDSFVSLIFGTGLLPVEAVQKNSDVGYIQDIWKFGIVGVILQYSIYIYMFKEASKKVKKSYPGLIGSIGIIVIIYMVKLNCLGYSMASVIFIPLIFASFVLVNKDDNTRIINNTINKKTEESL